METHGWYKKGYFGWGNFTVSESILISAFLATASFYSSPAFRLDRKVDRWYSKWTTNEWIAGWMTNLTFFTCMYIRMIMKRMKVEDNIKNKTSQNKQKKTINSIANQSSSKSTWKFRNSTHTVLLRYISSFLLFFFFAQTRGKTDENTFFYGITVDGRM